MEQAKALAILKSGKNVFLTGSAGAGKTYVLNQYITHLRYHKMGVAITASTGIAATHLGGQTIHSWCGMGVKDSLTTADLKNLKTKKYLVTKIDKAKVLVIDEISMLHKRQLELINKILKYFKQSEEPFGGLQVIVSGDFFQLPPVSDGNEPSKEKFCFMSDTWVEADFAVCYITQQFRQSDNKLTQILNEIRSQKVSEISLKTLHQSQENKPKGETTKLYTHNVDVDRINDDFFSKLKGTSKKFKATTKGNEKLSEVLVKSVLAQEEIALKKGTKVMFVKNNFEKGYVNGTLGHVFDFWDDDGKKMPIVKTNEGKNIYVQPEVWPMQDEKGKELASFEQIPLRLAWAITVHKSQGMTLDAAEIDLSKTFEMGQGYVALSRVSALEGLHLAGFNATALHVDSLAFKADKRFLELSNRAEKIYVDKELTQLEKTFIQNNGGVLKPLESSKKKGKAKTSKVTTYEATHDLLEQGLSLAEIAKKRELSEQTILRHFLIIQGDIPDYNFDKIKPPKPLIIQVNEALQKAKESDEELYSKNGHIKLGPIHTILKSKVDYKDIMLALLFCEK
jgi:ATP-dependent exoDNAse (exonuclease V) alpha subunit